MNFFYKLFVLALLASIVVLYSYDSSISIDGSGEKVNQLVNAGLGFIDEGEYELGFAEFEKLIESFPDHPIGYFFTSGTLLWIMIDFREYELYQRFFELSSKGLEVTEKYLKENPNDDWGIFFHAGLLGFRGIYHYESGSFFRAFFDAIKGVRLLKRLEKINPSIVDIEYGLGLYNFWQGYFSYNILGHSKGLKKKKIGIEKLNLSKSRGKYTKNESSKALIRVYFEEKNYWKALNLSQNQIDQYPGCLYCLRYSAVINSRLKRYKQSTQMLDEIKSKIKNSNFDNEFGLLEADIFMIENYLAEGKLSLAKRLVNELEGKLKKINLDEKPGIFKENFIRIEDDFKRFKKKLLRYQK